MRIVRTLLLAAAVAAPLGQVVDAHALSSLSVDKCLAGQVKIVGKGAAATLGCYARAASTGAATDSTCLAKASAKVGPPLAKIEAKLTCLVEGTGATRTSDVAAFGTATDGQVGHAAGKCDAAKTKLVGRYVAALTACYAKAAAKTGTVDTTCLGKAQASFAGGVAKAELLSGCSNTGQTTALSSAVHDFADAQACALDPANPGCNGTCGNGVSDPGEACDASVAPALWNACGPEFVCTNCNCACPSSITFSPDAAAPESVLDPGWIGLAHRAPLPTGGDLTLQVACPELQRPCGACLVTGLAANPQAGNGQLDGRRCTTNAARHCSTDADCAPRTCLGGVSDGMPCAADVDCASGTCPAAGTCVSYSGAPLPLSYFGMGMCVLNRIGGPVSGTLNLESGALSIATRAEAQVFSPFSADRPCPRCSDPGGMNDGLADGTCDGGARNGLPCDANGIVPGRPDFGATSLDCPQIPNALLATLPIDLGTATGPVVRTLTAASPNCHDTFSIDSKCLCDTCNNAAADPCASNADCPLSGGNPGVCGGRRCIGGTNSGAPCAVSSECGGGGCGRPGALTRPSACADDTSVADRDLECADPDGDGEGECTIGPTDQRCTVASGHGQRSCFSDADCGGGSGSCASVQRPCFLTGGGTFQAMATEDGTDTLVAVGMADAPVRDESNPTLGSVFCLGPTGSVPINTTAGLPGPARLTLKGHLVAHP